MMVVSEEDDGNHSGMLVIMQGAVFLGYFTSPPFIVTP